MRGSGRLVLALALTAAIYIPTVAQQTAQATCGVWRWPVKTLSDPDRTRVNFTPVGTSVAKFRTRTRPGITFGTSTPRYGAVEFHTWKVKARPIQANIDRRRAGFAYLLPFFAKDRALQSVLDARPHLMEQAAGGLGSSDGAHLPEVVLGSMQLRRPPPTRTVWAW